MDAAPVARLRKSRTRTKFINSTPALVISTLRPQQYDLRPACASLICPNCKTWVPITGVQGKVQKLVPHHAGTAGEDAAVRCTEGSNRQVVIDVAFEKWQRCLEEGAATAAGCRAARQFYKPMPKPAAPVHRMGGAGKTARPALRMATVERARTELAEHRVDCPVCNGRARCEMGRELEIRLRETFSTLGFIREQEGRRTGAAIVAEQRMDAERAQARAGQWRRVGLAADCADAERAVDRTRAEFTEHRAGCTACTGTGRCEPGRRMETSLRLAEITWKQVIERAVDRAHAELAEHRKTCTACYGAVQCERGRELKTRLDWVESPRERIAA